MFMPYFGAVRPRGLAGRVLRHAGRDPLLGPRLLIHGHPPLTENFTIEARCPGSRRPLREFLPANAAGIGEGRPLVEILHENILPASLREHPSAVIPYLVMRENFVKRVYHQRSGYWKPDGEGMEVLAPKEWRPRWNFLAGERESAFVRSARTLLGQGDQVLALKLADLGLLSHPRSEALATCAGRRSTGSGAPPGTQPFKFIIYSEWAGAGLVPIE